MILLSILYASLFTIATTFQVALEFHELAGREAELSFIATYESSTEPGIQGYVCAIQMKQADYGFNPITKWNIFTRNKTQLNQLIEQQPLNVHLRYIRLMLQEKTPGILGYKDNIEEDKCFLRTKLSVQDESDYLDAYIYQNTSL